jgi:hypothetical protein
VAVGGDLTPAVNGIFDDENASKRAAAACGQLNELVRYAQKGGCKTEVLTQLADEYDRNLVSHFRHL